MFLAVVLYLGAGVSLGTTPAVSVESKVKAAVSQDQVDAWVRLWQQRLRLDDWKIEARIVRSTDLKPDTLGNLKWNSVSHTAAIKVLNPIDYEMPAGEVAEDIEYTIVHELVHLQLSALPRDLGKKDVEEVVVNKISDALMQLEHGSSFRSRSAPQRKPAVSPGDPAPVTDVVGRRAPAAK